MDRLKAKETLDRASRCVDEEKLGQALELCAAVLCSAPRNARAFFIRAAALRKQGKRKEAVEAACEAARLRPDLPALVLAAGSLLCREKDFARALALYETALAEDSDKAQYHLGAAAALRKLGRNEEATAALRKAATAASTPPAGGGNPPDVQLQAQVQYKLGQHLRSTGDPASCALAAEAYGRCLELDPGHALAGFWLSATRKLAGVGGAEGVPEAACGQNGNAGNCADIADGAGTLSERPNENPPSAAPREYVVGLYNAYADTFDSHLQEALEYRTPAVIVENLAALFPARRYRRCLDLGCGTGLSGQAASSLCRKNLIGVDLSPAMVGKAKEKCVYRRLLVGDVTETVERLCRESKGISPAEGGAGTRFPGGWEVPVVPEEEGSAAATTTVVTGDDERAALRNKNKAIALSKGPAAPAPAIVGGSSSAAKPASECVSPPPYGGTSGSGSGTGSAGEQGELVISCDVFVYIGNLRPCFKAVHDLVTGVGSWMAQPQEPSAIFAFSVEAPPVTNATKSKEGGAVGEGQSGFELQGTGRYTHSREYLEAVCRDTGFRVLVSKEMVLRKNAGVPVRGLIFITEAALS